MNKYILHLYFKNYQQKMHLKFAKKHRFEKYTNAKFKKISLFSFYYLCNISFSKLVVFFDALKNVSFLLKKLNKQHLKNKTNLKEQLNT